MTPFIWIINSVLTIGFAVIQISCIPSTYNISQDIRSGLNPKMVGGQDAPVESARFVVAIFDSESFICGGALITLETVLTAATCTYRTVTVPCNEGSSYTYEKQPYNPSDLIGTVGNVNRIEGQRMFFSEIRRHGNFEHFAIGSDIATLLLSEPITRNNGIVPIPVSIGKTRHREHYIEAFFYGWKPIINSQLVCDVNADVLQVMKMRLLSTISCNRLFNLLHSEQLDNKELCGIPVGNGRFETGDNIGGPLITYVGDNKPVLIGILSKVNFRSGGNDVMSIFTKVYRYISWIRFNTFV